MANDRESENTDRSLDRRTILKGTAAAGLAGTALTGTASATDEKLLVLRSTGDEALHYKVAVTGGIQPGGPYETDAGDEIRDGRVAEGAVGEGRSDSYVFTGEIETLELRGPGKALVDGTVVRDTTLTNRITVRGQGEEVEYTFRVSGHVDELHTAEDTDTVKDGVVHGVVTDDVDEYRYSGAVTFEEADGPVSVTLDIDSESGESNG